MLSIRWEGAKRETLHAPHASHGTHSLRHIEQKKSQKVKGSDWSWVKKIAHTQRVPHASNATNTA